MASNEFSYTGTELL